MAQNVCLGKLLPDCQGDRKAAVSVNDANHHRRYTANMFERKKTTNTTETQHE